MPQQPQRSERFSGQHPCRSCCSRVSNRLHLVPPLQPSSLKRLPLLLSCRRYPRRHCCAGGSCCCQGRQPAQAPPPYVGGCVVASAAGAAAAWGVAVPLRLCQAMFVYPCHGAGTAAGLDQLAAAQPRLSSLQADAADWLVAWMERGAGKVAVEKLQSRGAAAAAAAAAERPTWCPARCSAVHCATPTRLPCGGSGIGRCLGKLGQPAAHWARGLAWLHSESIVKLQAGRSTKGSGPHSSSLPPPAALPCRRQCCRIFAPFCMSKRGLAAHVIAKYMKE